MTRLVACCQVAMRRGMVTRSVCRSVPASLRHLTVMVAARLLPVPSRPEKPIFLVPGVAAKPGQLFSSRPQP